MNHPKTLGIRHVALHCADLARMERFYCDILGYKVAWRPDQDNVYLSSGADNLALHAGAPPQRETRLDHFGLAVQRRLEVDGWNDYLRERGIAVRSGPRDHRDGSRSMYFEDPEGNVIQIIHLG